MVSVTRSILWFTEIGKDDIAEAGGKGANLGELTRAGIPVPPGFVVTAATYRDFVRRNRLDEVIRRELDGLDVHDTQQLQARAEAVRKAFLSAPMPPDIAAAIAEAYRELGDGPVAVRSSATAEDLPEASFAGQQSTFLNVVGEENVVRAVQACWASLFEARAIFYRAENGFDHLKVSLAVPVQRMVQSEKSGVMFTVEPVSSDTSKVTIEAVWGLGEAIVSGEISPDFYLLDKATLAIVSRQVTPQERMLVRASAGNGRHDLGNEWVPVPPEKVAAPKLSDSELVTLATIGLNVEAHYGCPQDIEWAFADGQFFIVQSRPVTTLRDTSHEEPEGKEQETAPVLLRGQAASPGVAAGRVKIVRDPSEIHIVEEGDILVAEMTTPDFVPAMKRAAAIVTERGGRTAHAAIVSRELGIPCVVGAQHAMTVLKPGALVTVDGSKGVVYEGRAERRLAWAERQRSKYAAAATLKTHTKLFVNLAEPELADVVAKRNVDGVGLLRAEFIVAQIGTHPRQFIEEGRPEEYTRQLAEGIAAFCRAFDPRPVVYRLTDFKTNEYANLRGGEKYEIQEENPMIGFRGASRYIREPDVFRLEVEAIKEVRRQWKNLYVMVPFVRTPAELRQVKQLMAQFGLVHDDSFKLWMMVEVPSNVLILDKFIDEGIDGISIGSNDLTQLVLGIDRDSELLADTFDERDEAVMTAMKMAITTARGRGLTVSICGQAPSVYPEVTERLVMWGATSVSVSPDMIDQTRQLIADVEARLGLSPAR
ncbi:MAG: phosphoenolpyruvate synthase [Chloroflexota bacterium]|nr:phosphoenolpyruvate synthase [Dehalococcoidia bacterium]MDW8046338.1 phosphoenolpyruvate synthase [Chloroflexota bacterium]